MRSVTVRSLLFATLVGVLVVSVARVSPDVPQSEVAGKISVKQAKPVEPPTPAETPSAPIAIKMPAPEATAPTEVSSADVASKSLKLDTEFASAKRIVPFAFNRVGVGPLGKAAVKELLPLAKKSEKVYVRGRTDGVGDTPSNRKVAQDRAYTVFKAFRNGGIERKKLQVTYCTYCYVASNDTEEGRSLNRRVEVEMLMPRDEIVRLPKPVHALEALPPFPLASSANLSAPPL